MPQPYASGTTVTHTPTQGAPWDGIVKGNTMECYLPVPPGPDTFKKRIYAWNESEGRWESGDPNFELYHLPGPPPTYEVKQDEHLTEAGGVQAVA